MIGPKLGRPRKDVDAKERDSWIKESGERNEVEAKFGVAKRRYGLDPYSKDANGQGCASRKRVKFSFMISLKISF
jgi:hypothetical protein